MSVRPRFQILSATLVLATLLLVAAPSRADDIVRTIEQSFDGRGLDSVYVDFPIGELTIEGTSSDHVEVVISLECDEDGWGSSSCPDRAERIQLDSRADGDRLRLEVEGYSKWRSSGLEIHMKVRAPEHLELSVDMNIGELNISGMRNDVVVDMSIGEANLRLPADAVAEVSMDAGIGESSLRTPDARRGASGLFVSETSWKDGAGEAKVRVDLGIGEIDIRLQ